MSDDPLPLPDAGATGASHPVSLSAAQAEEGRRAYFDFTVAACAAAGVDPSDPSWAQRVYEHHDRLRAAGVAPPTLPPTALLWAVGGS